MGSDLSSSESSLGGSASGILLTFLRYADARLHLLRLEAREVTGGFLRNLALIVVGILALALAYILVLGAALFLIQASTDWNWGWILGATGLIHLVSGLVFVIFAVGRLRKTDAFTESLNEFQKDRLWLARNQTPSPELAAHQRRQP